MTTPPPTRASAEPKNTPGLIALVASIAGSVLACIPGLTTVGWVLLPIAVILGIVGFLQSGRTKKTSIAAIVVSAGGALVSLSIVYVTVMYWLVELLFSGLLNDAS